MKTTNIQFVSDTTGFTINTWKYVAITVSTSGATVTTAIYYDGVASNTLTPSATAISNLPATSTNFTMNFIGKGISPTPNDQHLDAQLNDVKIFNSALSSSQVLVQYNSEKCNVYFKFINLIYLKLLF
jgi:hypothetical protein